MRTMTCIEDLRQAARRKVPRAFFDYAEAGSYPQETLRANRADLERIKLRQRVLVDCRQRSLRTTILGEQAPLPLALGADRALRHAARRRRDPRLPGGAGGRHSVHAVHHVDLLDRGRGGSGRQAVLVPALRDAGPRLHPALIERAAAAKCSALVLTVDLQVLGQRHCDIKNGMTVPPEIKLTNLIDIATKPAWAFSILKGKRKTFGNLAGHVQRHGERQPRWRNGLRASSIRR